MNWIRSSELLPVEKKRYLCVKRYEYLNKHYYEIQILTFNVDHQVWDCGGDFDCNLESVPYWQELPTLPI